ncbi:hypothetical protein [Amycolatopsis sp. H20-H5]|uniref:hypothetical protein n=1 Tax=Amycolatopsis sp. H20-H5 TaxID=3046309 RepID=UPI002DB80E87|nr:hypothetical protein [Amycolatopsis sp. H20-H5]MEC3974338.1 hypothetical protein [Amycolatopsis sp. H20-H5]
MDHRQNDPAELIERLADAVGALAECNYSGGEFEALIDELDAAFSDYRAHGPHPSP